MTDLGSIKVGVALKDKRVWIGVLPVIASLRQARPLCRAYRHTSFAGHKIKRADVLPRSGSYRAKEVKNNGVLSNNMSTLGLKTHRFPGTWVSQYRDSTAFSAYHHTEQISKRSF